MLLAKPHLMKGGDMSEDVYTTANNGVFVSKLQLNPVKPDVHVNTSYFNYFNKVIGELW